MATVPFRSIPLAALALIGIFTAGCATRSIVAPELRDPQKNTAVNPVPRDGNWLERHEGFVEIAKRGGVNVLFVGDSITDAWRRPFEARGGKPIWDRDFAPLGAENFGIGGDRTQHVLWRLENGELEGIEPRAVVLMIGTNNTGMEPDKVTPRNTPAETAAGIEAIVTTLRTRLPGTKILLLAVFPRGEKPDHPQRKQVAEINGMIEELGNGTSVHYLDIGAKFLTADGTLTKEIMPDFLHLSPQGYDIWAAAIKEPLSRLLQ